MGRPGRLDVFNFVPSKSYLEFRLHVLVWGIWFQSRQGSVKGQKQHTWRLLENETALSFAVTCKCMETLILHFAWCICEVVLDYALEKNGQLSACIHNTQLRMPRLIQGKLLIHMGIDLGQLWLPCFFTGLCTDVISSCGTVLTSSKSDVGSGTIINGKIFYCY